ncbi:hypothetical protein N7475_005196 [Penicillium sp. IBT 31633x]|nr:hypothetical protein N7475_005196 [Penicillium sp. IBT 31633x]
MSDNNPHHPGVRSLLAKFEGQSPILSPPSRGRSPASDSSGTTRQLSKVRASFITVDGVIHSNPASPLRKTSGGSESAGIFGPKINSGDVESGRQSTVSPTPVSRLEHAQNATLGQILAEGRPNTETKSEPNHTAKEEPATRTETASRLRNTSPKQTEHPKSTSSDKLSQKADSSGTIRKKPSSVGSNRPAARKHSPTTAASIGAKPAASNMSPKLTAREVAKERANSLAHKPSRVSLNPKTTTRPARGSTPAVAGASNKAGTRSPTRPVRGASTQASAARLGSTGPPSTRTTGGVSTLTRKPSSLKSATGGQPRATTPVANVRRQASRPSLPAHAANDATTKPVNEGFLARMMRPTASSANKSTSQEKADPKPVTKTVSTSKASRPSIGRVPEPRAPQVKPKGTPLRPQTHKSQAPHKEPALQKDGPKPLLKKQEDEKENTIEPSSASPKDLATVIPTSVAAVEQPEAASKPAEVTNVTAQVEEPVLETTLAPVESSEKSVEVPEPIVEETVSEISPAPVSVEGATEVSAEPTDSNEFQTSTKAEVAAFVEVPIQPNSEDAEEEKTAETTTPTEETAAEPVATLSPIISNEAEAEVAEEEKAAETTTPTEDTAAEPVATLSPIISNQAEAEVADKQDLLTPEPEVLETSEATKVQAEDPEKEASEKHDTVSVKGDVVSEAVAEVAEGKPAGFEFNKEIAPAAQPATEDDSTSIAIDIAQLALH